MATFAMDARRVAVIVVFMLLVASAAVWRLSTRDLDHESGSPPRLPDCEQGLVSVTWPVDGERVGCLEKIEDIVASAAARSRCELPGEVREDGSFSVRLPRIEVGHRLAIAPGRGGECAFLVSSLSGAERIALGIPIDLNSAGVADLMALSGIGPVLAEAIVSDREERGPFHGVEDLTRVRGIGPVRLERLSSYLVAEPLAGDEADEVPPD